MSYKSPDGPSWEVEQNRPEGDLALTYRGPPFPPKTTAASIAISDCRYHVVYSKLGKNEWLMLPILANLEAIERMIDLAGSIDRVVPGHDPLQFDRFPTDGRVARIQ